ncbi:tetratricopeptide repeat protein [Ectothiorhodospiraceae bacterium BW-2]|nr:tetratricopeptide repeat protein [Ectothiorhodospiraceae bacterium BW-2]QEP42396.1 tetratricopeptide repeat protein [Ectothiorhodospiraceae bacterium BW-2]
MSNSDYLTVLNILIAFIGVGFAALAVWEWWSLRSTRAEFEQIKAQIRRDNHLSQKAQQRIIASYQLTDIDAKIALLLSAVEIAPASFNGYNALGYAYLEKGDMAAAEDAFHEAITHQPQDKEGYFDLASLHLAEKRIHLVKKYLSKAIDIDPSSKQDIENNPQLKAVMNK